MANAYETLDDVKMEGITTLHALYNAIFGKALADPRITGFLITGPVTLGGPGSGFWGLQSIAFETHSETWQARLHPAGKMGKPLEHGERRTVSVLLKSKRNVRVGRVTSVTVWLRSPCIERLNLHPDAHDRGGLTLGAIGVAACGVHFFHQKEAENEAHNKYHCVLSGYETVFHETGRNVVRVEPAPTPHHVVAASIEKSQLPDVPPMRHCHAATTQAHWVHELRRSRQELEDVLDSDAEDVASCIFNAVQVFESVSLLGFLDMMSASVLEGALPDDVGKPCGVCLLVAIAVRLAAVPENYELLSTVSDDAYASRQVAALFESMQPSIFSQGANNAGVSVFAIDLVLHNCIQRLTVSIDQLKKSKGGKSSRVADSQALTMSVKESLQALFYQGVQICNDVAGLTPPMSSEILSDLNDYGAPTSLLTPTQESIASWAEEGGLGRIQDQVPVTRFATRPQRQRTLMAILRRVEGWVRTNKCDGAFTVVPKPIGEKLADLLSPDGGTATKRHAKERCAPLSQTLTTRAARRHANNARCIDQAVASLIQKREQATRDDIEKQCQSKLHAGALNEASGVLGDVLQLGLVFGTTNAFAFTCFLVSSTSSQPCSVCKSSCQVIETFAFAGDYANCPKCDAPRCLKCVTRAIEAKRDLNTCRFCDA
jgi:hypothetical protein